MKLVYTLAIPVVIDFTFTRIPEYIIIIVIIVMVIMVIKASKRWTDAIR